MALSILDGNKNAATLSTIVVSASHIPAHTIVSLGIQAQSDISNAISNTSVCISNLPIGGLGEQAPNKAVLIGGYNLDDNYIYPFLVDSGGLQSVKIASGTVFSGGEGEGGTPNEAVAIGWVEETITGGNFKFASKNNPLPISGTVTANVFGADIAGNTFQIPVEINSNGISDKFIPIGFNDDGDARQVNTNSPLPIQAPNGIAISGTVTANVNYEGALGGNLPEKLAVIAGYVSDDSEIRPLPLYTQQDFGQQNNRGVGVHVISSPNISGTVTASVTNSVTVGSLPVQLSTTTIGGTSRLNVTLSSATTVGATAPSYGNLSGGSDGTNFRAILTDTSGRTVVTGSVSLTSTTVTVSALPSGALTTRLGSVTTANTSQITTAVTNTSRKYLLAQNISAGTVTIGIGFSPTTTQGIQLTAGAGITFDSFCPTGAVYWLGATTGANFTILEG